MGLIFSYCVSSAMAAFRKARTFQRGSRAAATEFRSSPSKAGAEVLLLAGHVGHGGGDPRMVHGVSGANVRAKSSKIVTILINFVVKTFLRVMRVCL